MGGVDYEAVRMAWLSDGMSEPDVWCRHLAAKVRGIIELQRNSDRIALIEQSEAIFGICAVINRLAHIALRTEKRINSSTLTAWLSETSGWPQYVAEAFWSCIRNPTMHSGRSWSFADHRRRYREVDLFAGIHPDWSMTGYIPPALPESLRAADPYLGFDRDWHSRSGAGGGDLKASAPTSVTVTFYVPGVLLTLAGLRNSVLEGLRTATERDLRKLQPVAAQTGFLKANAEAPDSLPELDLTDHRG